MNFELWVLGSICVLLFICAFLEVFEKSDENICQEKRKYYFCAYYEFILIDINTGKREEMQTRIKYFCIDYIEDSEMLKNEMMNRIKYSCNRERAYWQRIDYLHVHSAKKVNERDYKKWGERV